MHNFLFFASPKILFKWPTERNTSLIAHASNKQNEGAVASAGLENKFSSFHSGGKNIIPLWHWYTRHLWVCVCVCVLPIIITFIHIFLAYLWFVMHSHIAAAGNNWNCSCATKTVEENNQYEDKLIRFLSKCILYMRYLKTRGILQAFKLAFHYSNQIFA